MEESETLAYIQATLKKLIADWKVGADLVEIPLNNRGHNFLRQRDTLSLVEVLTNLGASNRTAAQVLKNTRIRNLCGESEPLLSWLTAHRKP